MTSPSVTLDQMRAGDWLCVVRISDPVTATNAMRLGIAAGEHLQVASKVPGGPIVIRRDGLEVALGRDLCREIVVESVERPHT